MSKYTTGEIATLCGVSVRTVQYYDSRGILTPSELSEGGRRLYSDSDLKRLRTICFLRELGFSIKGIGEIFAEKEPAKLISLLLSERERELREEAKRTHSQLDALEEIKRGLKASEDFSVESIGDVAAKMSDRKKLRNLRILLVSAGLFMEAVEISMVILWVKTGIWWPFAVGMAAILALSLLLSLFYFSGVGYICPQCHESFKPRLKEAFWAYHTPRMRRLTCPKCGVKSLCAEIYKRK